MSTLPFSVELIIPGFKEKHVPGNDYTLAPKKRDCEKWFNEFIDKIVKSIGKEFFTSC